MHIYSRRLKPVKRREISPVLNLCLEQKSIRDQYNKNGPCVAR